MSYKNETFTVRIPESFMKEELTKNYRSITQAVANVWNTLENINGIHVYISECVCTFNLNNDGTNGELTVVITGERHCQDSESLEYQATIFKILGDLKLILFQDQNNILAVEWIEYPMDLILLD